MKKITVLILIATSFFSCSDKENVPDVSDIKVNLTVQRFEKDFFSMDTMQMENAFNQLQSKYPSFLNDFLYNILALPPQKDSALQMAKKFLYDYKPVYDAAEKQFTSTKKIEEQLTRGLQFVKYYFPKYTLPQNLITFVGPIEGYANVLTQGGLAVGLQLYLGKDYPVYHSAYISEVYPAYQQRRFEPDYIVVNCMKNMVSDVYPENNRINGEPLIYQMIEAGKRLYLLDKFLPETADSLKTGYTQKQLDGCFKNEGLIWNYFVQNNLLFITDPIQTRDYMSDGPRTEALGPDSPGFIGQFVGWQIIKKWLSSHDKITPEQLLQIPGKQIYEEAKYKPR